MKINDKIIRKFNTLFSEMADYYEIGNLVKRRYYKMNREDYIYYLTICDDSEGFTNRLVEVHIKKLNNMGHRMMRPFQEFSVLVIGGQYKLITPELYEIMNESIKKIRKNKKV